MADENKSDSWAWLGVLASVIAVVGFFGITNFTQLEHWLNGKPTPNPTATASPSPTCKKYSVSVTHCGVAFFTRTGMQWTGDCGCGDCSMSATYRNDGQAAGSGTADFIILGSNSSGTVVNGDIVDCYAVIPWTQPGVVIQVACSAFVPPISAFYKEYPGGTVSARVVVEGQFGE